jgi:hypothetical protein
LVPMVVGLLAQEAEPPSEGSSSSGWVLIAVVVGLVVVVAIGLVIFRRSGSRPVPGPTAPGVADDRAKPSAAPEATDRRIPTEAGASTTSVDHPAPTLAAAPVGVFISYRRNDAPHLAGRLFDRLREHFGRERIFMDVDSIEPGLDFGEVIADAVRSSKVMLVVIGPKWLVAEDGSRRIDSVDDYVRIELEQALGRGIRVIPVLVDGATMPQSVDLPDALKSLARRNAIEVTHRAFTADADRLIELTDRLLTT